LLKEDKKRIGKKIERGRERERERERYLSLLLAFMHANQNLHVWTS